ncbi:MAG: ABC transporter permease [Rhodospirillaceae bacterium]|nr:ABC transporter permease [Rhodospirillaceae bacterium]
MTLPDTITGWDWRASAQRIWFLMRREFLAIWKDKRSRTVLILPPIIQLFVFSYAATFDVKNATLGILNEDNGPAGRELVARFSASGAFDPVARLTSVREIAPLIENEKALAVLHIGPTFSRDLLGARNTGRTAEIQFIVDGRHSNTALIANGYAGNIVEEFTASYAASQPGAVPRMMPRLVTHAWFNPNFESRWFIITGLVATLTMIVASVTTSLSVARERELGTFEQLLVTPLRPLEILVGKILPPAILALGEGILLALIGITIFGIPMRGDPLLIIAGLAVFMLSVTSLGVMISSLASTQQQAMISAFCFMMPAIILSGFATPIENMPEWLQVATYANPLRYMLVISRGVFLQDMPASLVLANIWPMAVIGVITASAAAWLFRNRLQ